MKRRASFLFGLCLAVLFCAASLHTTPHATVQALSPAELAAGPAEAETSQPAAPVQDQTELTCSPGASTSPVFWDVPPHTSSVIILSSGEEITMPGPDDEVRVIVQLEGDPVAVYKRHLQTPTAHLTQAEQEWVRAYDSAVREGHRQLLQQASAAGISLQVRRAYTYVFNGLAASSKMADMERIAALPGVLGVYRDYEAHALLEDSVPLIGADSVWTMLDPSGRPVTGQGVRVAVLDTGIDYNHPDLGAGFGPGYKVAGGYDFVNDDPDPMDDRFHGTHVAGILAANGSVKGVAPDATLYAYKVLNAEGKGSDSTIIAGIERAANPDGDPATDDAVDIISMSLGGPGGPDEPLAQAVDAAFDEGVLVVVAAGNEGPAYASMQSPGVARRAFTVGASTKSDTIADFSSRGPVSNHFELTKPDIIAPGVDIISTYPGGRYAALQGTSMSTPHVAGCAALIKQLHPSWSPQIIQANLMNTAHDLSLDIHTQGAGRVQVDDAANAPAVLTPGSIGFGLVETEQPLWTQNRTLHLSNVGTAEQAFSLHVSEGLPDGVTTYLNPDHVTLEAGQTATIAFTITVDPAVTPDLEEPPSAYKGQVIAQCAPNGQRQAQASPELLVMPFTFFKGHYLQITFDREPDVVIVHNSRTQWKINAPNLITTLVLPEGTYDVWAIYGYSVWVIREDVAVSGPTGLTISRSEAVYSVTLVPRDCNGVPLSSGYKGRVETLKHLPSGQQVQLISYLTPPMLRHFSDMSTDYLWEWRIDAAWQGAFYQFYDRMVGMDGDFTYQNDPEDLWHITYHCHPPPGQSQLKLSYFLPYG